MKICCSANNSKISKFLSTAASRSVSSAWVPFSISARATSEVNFAGAGAIMVEEEDDDLAVLLLGLRSLKPRFLGVWDRRPVSRAVRAL